MYSHLKAEYLHFLSIYLFIPNTTLSFNLKEQYESQHLRSGTRLITILVTAFRRTAVTFSDWSPIFSPHPPTETDPSPPMSYDPIMSLPQIPYIFLYTLQVMWFNTKIRTYCFTSSNSILLDFCKTLEPIRLVLIVSSYTTLISLLQHNSFPWSNFLLINWYYGYLQQPWRLGRGRERESRAFLSQRMPEVLILGVRCFSLLTVQTTYPSSDLSCFLHAVCIWSALIHKRGDILKAK